VSGRNLRVVLGAGVLAVFLTGCIGFTVTKEVDGDAPDDATFVVRIECDNTLEGFDDLVFDDEGTQFTQFFAGPGTTTCVITEPEDAEADETTIECVDLPTDPDVTVTCTPPDDDQVTVTFTATVEFDVEVGIRVTNEFDPPDTTTTSTTLAPQTAPLAVEVSPTFTG